MASAECDNCGHDWDLRKHPDDYARGGPSCPECGSTRVEVSGGTPPAPARRGAERPAPATDAGDLGGDLVRVVDADLPASERLSGLRRIVSAGMDIADAYNDYRQRKLEEQEMRAQRVELGDPETIPFPTCENCDYTFDESDIPLNAAKVRCPKCTTLYPLVEPDEPIEA